MGWKFVVNIKGDKGNQGDQGPKGDQGIPGFNAAPTDAGVASLVAVASATQIALDARFGGTTSTLYVSSAKGNDLNSGGTTSQALKTFDAAFTKIGAGAGVIVLAPDETFPVTKSYTLDVNRHAIRGERSRIDTTGAPALSTIFTVTGSLLPPQFQSWTVMSGVELYGGALLGATQTALYFHKYNDSSSRGAAQTQWRNIIIRGYAVGIELGDQAYNLTFDGCQVGHCTVGLHIGAGVNNSGERISFINGVFFNSPTFIATEWTNSILYLINVSLDYFTKQCLVISSQVNLIGCHVEFNMDLVDALPAFELRGNGSSMRMTGGTIRTSTADASKTMPYIIANGGAWRNASVFDSVLMNGMMTSTGDFATGPGCTIIENEINFGGSTGTFADLGAGMSLLADGGFEDPTFVDNWWIHSDATVPTTRVMTGTNLAVTQATTNVRTGTKAMRLKKNTATSTPAGVSLVVPMAGAKTPHARFWYKNTVTASGTLYVTYYAAILRFDGGVPVVAKKTQLYQALIDTTVVTAAWTESRMSRMMRMPGWSSHLLVEFSLTSTSSAFDFYVDDFTVSQS